MFYSYFAVLFLCLISVVTGNSSKFLKLNPKNCTTVHTGDTCRYEFFKYFNGDPKTIYIVQKTRKIRCSNKGFLDLLENDHNKFSIYTKRYNYNIEQREVNGFWISGKELGTEVSSCIRIGTWECFNLVGILSKNF